ncbi:MAG: FliG C-terminal domain-containing protein [Pseudomonadota bacterium]
MTTGAQTTEGAGPEGQSAAGAERSGTAYSREHTKVPAAPAQLAALGRTEKAAIIIGALGVESAGPILAELDESALKSFTAAMARLRRVNPEVVRHVIAEFLDAIRQQDTIVRGGLNRAREVLEPHVNDTVLSRLLDDVDSPSVNNVWKKLSKVSEEALADFLAREHPQTAAVILSKLTSEHAARVLNRFEPDRAREIVLGITRTQSLDPNVIEAIGASVSRDFLAGNQHTGPRRNPAERVGSIMNFVSTETRDHVLGHIEEHQPEFAEEIRRKMFTFDDIPRRIAQRDIAAVVREADRDTLLRALRFAADNGSDATEFVLTSISSRVAEQLRGEMAEIDKVRRKDAENAQAAVVAIVRQLEARGELKLLAPEED